MLGGLKTRPVTIQDWFASREKVRIAFLADAEWPDSALSPIGEDCAFRRYFRLEKNGRTAVLMESVPDNADMATPGHSMGDFIRIGAMMGQAGLNTPEIFAMDEENGYVLMQDFGDTSFKAAIRNGVDIEELYALATDVLSYMAQNIKKDTVSLPHYYESHVHRGRRRVVDWYLPVSHKRKNEDGTVESYIAAWDEIEQSLSPCPQGFLHIDYHVENLMWLPQESGLGRCGVLDYQGAMWGPVPYDLANLLEDAREDIGDDLRQKMLNHFCANMDQESKAIFLDWYRVLGTQFHCRVVGQFIRLAVRDGKDRYLQHLPRVIHYIREGIENPVLKPLKTWFANHGAMFDSVPEIIPEKAGQYIRDDAF